MSKEIADGSACLLRFHPPFTPVQQRISGAKMLPWQTAPVRAQGWCIARLLISNYWLAFLRALWETWMPPCKPHRKDSGLGTLSKFKHRPTFQETAQPMTACFNPEQHERRKSKERTKEQNAQNPGDSKQRDEDKPCSFEKDDSSVLRGGAGLFSTRTDCTSGLQYASTRCTWSLQIDQ